MGETADLARGHWRQILPQLGISQKFLKKKQGPCPACGGKDRFWFNDRTRNGDYFCRKCGPGQGISLIMKVRGWDYKTAARAVDEILGNRFVNSEPLDAAHLAAKAFFDSCPDVPDPWEPEKSTADATLWLRRFNPLKLPEWLMRHDPMLEVWINRERPFGYWLSDKKYICDGSLINIKRA